MFRYSPPRPSHDKPGRPARERRALQTARIEPDGIRVATPGDGVGDAPVRGFALAGWLVGGGPISVVLFVLAYIAGGIAATFVAIASLLRLRLSIDLLMILAAVGAASWATGSRGRSCCSCSR